MDENFTLNLETCCFCLELIEKKDIHRCKNCLLAMHKVCIQQYLKENNNYKCLNCNNKIDFRINYLDYYEFVKGLCLLIFCFSIVIIFIFIYN